MKNELTSYLTTRVEALTSLEFQIFFSNKVLEKLIIVDPIENPKKDYNQTLWNQNIFVLEVASLK